MRLHVTFYKMFLFLFLENFTTEAVKQIFPKLVWDVKQGLHRLEKYLNLEGFIEKSLKIKYAMKSSTGKSCKGLEKSLNSIFCRN